MDGLIEKELNLKGVAAPAIIQFNEIDWIDGGWVNERNE